MSQISKSELFAQLDHQAIELPSWAFGNSGTRFRVFGSAGTPRNPQEKIEDAAQVHKYSGIAPSVALHIPWDKVDDYADLSRFANDHGIKLGTINSNTFQHLSTVLNTFKRNYMLEFTQGVSLALCTETFNKFSQNEKERLLYCFINCDCETVQRMKQLAISVSNVLRNQGTFDAIVATEIAIGSAHIRRATIEIDN
jgi:hypothetical protein